MQAQMERTELNLETVDLIDIAGDVVRDYEAAVRSHPLHYQGDGVCPILGDRKQLKRMLLNLLSNATGQSAPGREVTICVLQCGAHVHLIVQDEGLGTMPASLERWFLPFKPIRDLPSTGKEDHRYLASIQNIIEAHGGDISIQGMPEQGTAINVCFKVCRHECAGAG